jgi:perosamine synthetase
MTYVPADALLDVQTLRAASRGRKTEGWPGLPPGTVFMENGRAALWAALRALGLGQGDRLALPAYICDSVLPAPDALGVEARYVATNRRLELDLEALEQELAAGARAALLVHYFGFPSPSTERAARLCETYGAALIEDCAHALFSQSKERPLGQQGAAAFFSLWKTLPLPDGGALVLNRLAPPADLANLPRPSLPETARRLAYRAISLLETAVGRSPRLRLLRSERLRRSMQARTARASLVPRRSSALTRRAVAAVDWSRIVARRRENYARLASALREAHWARPLYDQLPPGVCPLAFPILADDREWARRRLLMAGINVRAYWEQLPCGVAAEAFPDAHYIADRILVLPVHQSLSRRMMDELVGAIASFKAKRRSAWGAASPESNQV